VNIFVSLSYDGEGGASFFRSTHTRLVSIVCRMPERSSPGLNGSLRKRPAFIEAIKYRARKVNRSASVIPTAGETQANR
jgi:hypothetical protein